MVKSVIKEIIIILLLVVAVVLALGVVFYQYIPNNKAVPKVSTYKTAESVEKELQEQVTEDETVLVTYEITSDDLKNLQKTNTYVGGKENPFSTYEPPVQNTEDPNSTNVNSVGTNVNSMQGGQTTNTNSSNTFYKNTGTK